MIQERRLYQKNREDPDPDKLSIIIDGADQLKYHLPYFWQIAHDTMVRHMQVSIICPLFDKPCSELLSDSDTLHGGPLPSMVPVRNAAELPVQGRQQHNHRDAPTGAKRRSLVLLSLT